MIQFNHLQTENLPVPFSGPITSTVLGSNCNTPSPKAISCVAGSSSSTPLLVAGEAIQLHKVTSRLNFT